jgi:hypothetical protein
MASRMMRYSQIVYYGAAAHHRLGDRQIMSWEKFSELT